MLDGDLPGILLDIVIRRGVPLALLGLGGIIVAGAVLLDTSRWLRKKRLERTTQQDSSTNVDRLM